MAKRKSTAGNLVGTGGSFEAPNTGLRPSWAEFWEAGGSEDSSRTTSALSGGRARPAQNPTAAEFRHVRFVSGGEWRGEWGPLGMNGFGTYRMPHGVAYHGQLRGGAFEGVGVLRYPNGGAVEGLWRGGRLVCGRYAYADGLRRGRTPGWPYCETPDRRFYSEIARGLKAADTEQLADAEPPADLPAGAYDVADGVHDPRTKCTVDPATGAVLRVPTVAEERWILDRCRSAAEDPEPVGFRPDLYENWYEDESTEAEDTPRGDEEREILRLTLQLGYDLHTTEPMPAQSNSEFDEFVRRAVKEAEEASCRLTLNKRRSAAEKTEAAELGEWFAEESDDENCLAQIIKEISQKYLVRGETASYDSKTDTVTSATTVEMLRMRNSDLPTKIHSHATPAATPLHDDFESDFSRTLSTAPIFPVRQNIAEECEEYERTHWHRHPDSAGEQERLNFKIDYEEYDSDDRVESGAF